MRSTLTGLLLLALMTVPASAADERTNADERGGVPSASEVIAEMYQFDLFQQNAVESSDLHGNETVRNFAVVHADTAAKRDKALKTVQNKIGKDAGLGKKPSSERGDRLASLETSSGPDYVRKFYATQVAEHESAVSLLERYLAAPDDAMVGEFAATQLPVLRAGLRDAGHELTDK